MKILIPILLALSICGCVADLEPNIDAVGLGTASDSKASTHTEGDGNKITTVNMTGASLSMIALGFGLAVTLFNKYRGWKKVADSMIEAVESFDSKDVKETVRDFSLLNRTEAMLMTRVKQLTGK